MKNIIKFKILIITVCTVATSKADNGDDCPWVPDQKGHFAEAKLGVYTIGSVSVDFKINFTYGVAWLTRKCGTKSQEYKYLTWKLTKPFPQNQPIPNGVELNFSLLVNGIPQTVTATLPNGCTWSVYDIGSTKGSGADDRMEISSKLINFANHLAPPPGTSSMGSVPPSKANPHTCIVDGPGTSLIFKDGGHGVFFKINNNVGDALDLPVGFVWASGMSFTNPPVPPTP